MSLPAGAAMPLRHSRGLLDQAATRPWRPGYRNFFTAGRNDIHAAFRSVAA